MALNAMHVDPQQVWKGPWRWYGDEPMVNCCFDIESIQKRGITLFTFAGMAVCQGLDIKLHYVDSDSTSTSTAGIESSSDEGENRFRQTVLDVTLEGDKVVATVEDAEDHHLDVALDKVLAVSYDRKVLGQTGSGHFSPIAAYDPVADSVLILDTARFKYGSHWVPLPLLYRAMMTIDPDSGRSRGYVVLSPTRQRVPAVSSTDKPECKTTDKDGSKCESPASCMAGLCR